MSSHIYSYVETVNENLVCCICRAAFTDPVTTRTCAHTFCRSCITHALSISPQCPVDRSSLATRDLLPASQVIRNMVDELVVDCPNRPECTHTCQRHLLNAHMQDECGYTEMNCPANGCNVTILRKDAGKHCCHTKDDSLGNITSEIDHGQTENSPYAVGCHGCLMELPPEILNEHLTECPFVYVSCTHASYGCEWSGPRSDLPVAHLLSCPYEAMKGFFRIHDMHVSALSEENALLRHKVEALEGLVSIMQREMRYVKDALGPWYREQDEPTRVQGSSQSLLTSPLLHNAFDTNVSLESNPASPVNNGGDGDILAPFFASLSLESPAPSHLPRPSILQPSIHHAYRGSFMDATSPHTPSLPPAHSIPSTTHIAPLDLASPLPDTLAGLRQSMITLAGALDSSTRRTDIALAADEARTSEELGALKAAVHGLRLQVHSLMVDRNVQITSRFASSPDGAGSSAMPPTSTAFQPMRYMSYPFPLSQAMVHGPISPPPVSTKL